MGKANADSVAMKFGIHTFGDVTKATDGSMLHDADVLRNVLNEGILADKLGIDAFGVGEHHRADFAISAPETLLAGLATRTENIRLNTAVTVLSTDDPVRVYQRFATVDALSNGRAEPILGRGSFTESYPLFGYNLHEYDLLFEERLQIFSQLRDGGEVNWRGSTRTPLENQTVFPKIKAARMKSWVGVGGSPDSVVRAARYDFPLMLAIIGGSPSRFRPFVDLYHESMEKFGHENPEVAVHCPGFIAETDAEAKKKVWPHHQALFARIGRERGWPPMQYDQFEYGASEDGALFIGSPETVAQKIVKVSEQLGINRFDMKYSNGTLPHEDCMESIKLFVTEVIPRVHELREER